MMLEASVINSSILWNNTLEKAHTKFDSSGESADLLNLCYAYYGIIGNCLSTNNMDLGEEYVQKAIILAEELGEDEEYKSIAYSLQGGFKGLAIAFNPMKGMILGPESDKLIKKSIKLHETNSFAWLQKGSSEYNTPRLFGGSITKSIESFKKSIECFDSEDTDHLWLKIEAMTWLGQAYHETKNYDKAKEVYLEVLKIAPGYQWVEDHLLIKTEKRLKS